MSVPTVTVSVLNYQRRDALQRVLGSIHAQDYPALETIVVDNGSGEDTVSWIRSTYPWVRLISLLENTGTAARNAGIRAAAGEIIVTLDNDVYFDGPAAVQEVVAAFGRHPAAGCVAFRVYHPDTGRLHARDWCHPRPWQRAEAEEFETCYLTEGAAAFRRQVFEHLEPYWEELWIGHEGFDLGLRLMDAGYEIWYTPAVKVWHMASRETRQSWRPFYFNTRNLFLVVYRNHPWKEGLMHLLPRLALLGFYAVRDRCLRHYLRGIWDGWRDLRRVRPLRRPVRRSTLRKRTALRRAQPHGLARFARHWRKTEF